jgi:hypothetical protein
MHGQKNIKLREIGCEVGRWMELAQDRVQVGFVIIGVEACGSASRELV